MSYTYYMIFDTKNVIVLIVINHYACNIMRANSHCELKIIYSLIECNYTSNDFSVVWNFPG